jgi:hypothetical protein
MRITGPLIPDSNSGCARIIEICRNRNLSYKMSFLVESRLVESSPASVVASVVKLKITERMTGVIQTSEIDQHLHSSCALLCLEDIQMGVLPLLYSGPLAPPQKQTQRHRQRVGEYWSAGHVYHRDDIQVEIGRILRPCRTNIHIHEAWLTSIIAPASNPRDTVNGVASKFQVVDLAMHRSTKTSTMSGSLGSECTRSVSRLRRTNFVAVPSTSSILYINEK